MKRSGQIQRHGVPDPKAGRSETTPKRPWRENEPPIVLGHLKTATVAFAARGSQGAIEALGSKAKFHAMAPEIKARIKLWLKRAKDFE